MDLKQIKPKRETPIGIHIMMGCALLLFLAYTCIQVKPPEVAATPVAHATPSAEVLADGINDDGQGTAYIKVSNALSKGPDAAIAEIMVKKQQWKKQSRRRIVSVSIVPGSDKKLYEQTFVAGLLIHYE